MSARARRAAGSIQQGAKEHQNDQLPELEAQCEMEQGDQGDRGAAGQIGEDAGAPVSEAIDQGSAQKTCQDHGQDGEETDQARPRGAARGLEDVPGDDHGGEHVAHHRDGIGSEDREQRQAVAGNGWHAGWRGPRPERRGYST